MKIRLAFIIFFFTNIIPVQAGYWEGIKEFNEGRFGRAQAQFLETPVEDTNMRYAVEAYLFAMSDNSYEALIQIKMGDLNFVNFVRFLRLNAHKTDALPEEGAFYKTIEAIFCLMGMVLKPQDGLNALEALENKKYPFASYVLGQHYEGIFISHCKDPLKAFSCYVRAECSQFNEAAEKRRATGASAEFKLAQADLRQEGVLSSNFMHSPQEKLLTDPAHCRKLEVLYNEALFNLSPKALEDLVSKTKEGDIMAKGYMAIALIYGIPGLLPADIDLAKTYVYESLRALQRVAVIERNFYAKHILGVFYTLEKLYTDLERTEALLWLLSSVEDGHADSSFMIGSLYGKETGSGNHFLEISEDSAKEAGELALGNWQNIYRLYQAMQARGSDIAENIVKVMRDSQKSSEQKRDTISMFWFAEAARNNNAMAAYEMGERFASGRGVSVDGEQAFNAYLLSAKAGYVTAQEKVGLMLYNGTHVAEDKVAGKAWIRKAMASDTTHNFSEEARRINVLAD